ncbi:hypothetical protein KI387_034666, partial [Taxus chinensis]
TKDPLNIQKVVKEADPSIHHNTPYKELVVSGFPEVNDFEAEDENENENPDLEE